LFDHEPIKKDDVRGKGRDKRIKTRIVECDGNLVDTNGRQIESPVIPDTGTGEGQIVSLVLKRVDKLHHPTSGSRTFGFRPDMSKDQYFLFSHRIQLIFHEWFWAPLENFLSSEICLLLRCFFQQVFKPRHFGPI